MGGWVGEAFLFYFLFRPVEHDRLSTRTAAIATVQNWRKLATSIMEERKRVAAAEWSISPTSGLVCPAAEEIHHSKTRLREAYPVS